MQKLNASDREIGDEDVVFKDVHFRKKAKRVTIALAVVIFLLFVLCVVFIVLFAVQKRKSHEEPTQETPQRKICDSRKCLLSAIGKFVAQFFIYVVLYPVFLFFCKSYSQ